MSAQDNLIIEYQELRSEIQNKVELHNSLVTFMITTVIAVLAFALESDNILLYLLPFGIIIPISMRIVYYRSAMVKLSAYIIVFLESNLTGLKWETRNRQFVMKNGFNFYDKVTTSHYYEGIILSIICYTLYIWSLLENKKINIFYIGLPLLLLIWEAVITNRIKSFDKDKEKLIKGWSELKSN